MQPSKNVKIRIKQVPDAGPNAAGEWIEREVDPVDLSGEYRAGHTLWDNLNKLCDPGHHAVKYHFPEEPHAYKKAMNVAVATGDAEFLKPENGNRRFTTFSHVATLTAKGVGRVLDGREGMTFVVEKFCGADDRCASVVDRRYPQPGSRTGFQTWTLGPDDYELLA